MKDYKKIYEEWLSNPYFDEETKEELRAIADNENEIKERFYIKRSMKSGSQIHTLTKLQRKNCEQLRETKKKSKNAFMRIWSLVLPV